MAQSIIHCVFSKIGTYFPPSGVSRERVWVDFGSRGVGQYACLVRTANLAMLSCGVRELGSGQIAGFSFRPVFGTVHWLGGNMRLIPWLLVLDGPLGLANQGFLLNLTVA